MRNNLTKEKKSYYATIIKIFLFLMISFSIICFIYVKAEANHKDTILINEVCADNFNIMADEDGKYKAYIELYNMSDHDISLDNWYLVNIAKKAKKLVLKDIVIKPKSYQIITTKEQESFSIPEGGGPICLANSGARIVDRVKLPELKVNTTFARIKDGNHEWQVMSGTPGQSNELGTIITEEQLERPIFSKESGFYEDSFQLELFCEGSDKICYTLDGTDPTENSLQYKGPIQIKDISNTDNRYASNTSISTAFLLQDNPYVLSPEPVDKAMIVKAKAFDVFGGESEIATNTYFIGYNKKENYKNIPVISVVTDPDNLFSYEKGIYTTGIQFEENPGDKEALPWYWWNANYRMTGRAWERPVHIDYFDAEKNLVLSQESGIRIKGGGSRGQAQKSMNLYAREVYDGNSEFETYFFEGDQKEDSITLFSGGDDSLATKAKDCLIGELMADRDIATMQSFPCYVFLCGEYWGIYNLSENYDASYIESHYQVDEDNVIMVKNGEIEEGKKEELVLYQDLLDYVSQNDLADDNNYLEFCNRVDIQSLMDYYGCQIYIARCADWPASNYALWRSRTVSKKPYEDGKWRWMLFDVNSDSMVIDLMHENTIARVMDEDVIFGAVMRNQHFRKDFARNFEELSSTVFDSDVVLKKLDEYIKVYKNPMVDYYHRYYCGLYNESLYLYHMDNLKEFYEGRKSFILRDVQRICGVE